MAIRTTARRNSEKTFPSRGTTIMGATNEGRRARGGPTGSSRTYSLSPNLTASGEGGGGQRADRTPGMGGTSRAMAKREPYAFSPLYVRRFRRNAISYEGLLGLRRGPRGQLVGSTGSGRAEKQLASVRECKIPAVGAIRPVFRLVPIDYDIGAGQQGVLGESAPEQDIR